MPAIIKSTLAALINDSFYHTHLKMPKIPPKLAEDISGQLEGLGEQETQQRDLTPRCLLLLL